MGVPGATGRIERAILPDITRLALTPGHFVALLRGARNRTHRRAEPNPVRRKKRDHRTWRRLAHGKGLWTFLCFATGPGTPTVGSRRAAAPLAREASAKTGVAA